MSWEIKKNYCKDLIGVNLTRSNERSNCLDLNSSLDNRNKYQNEL